MHITVWILATRRFGCNEIDFFYKFFRTHHGLLQWSWNSKSSRLCLLMQMSAHFPSWSPVCLGVRRQFCIVSPLLGSFRSCVDFMVVCRRAPGALGGCLRRSVHWGEGPVLFLFPIPYPAWLCSHLSYTLDFLCLCGTAKRKFKTVAPHCDTSDPAEMTFLCEHLNLPFL